jgi:dTMP kinase
VTGGSGRFITIEGPDGSGKTTQVERLADRLRAAGYEVLVTREPGGTRLGEQLREILLARHGGVEPTDALTDAFLFEAARRQLVRQVIRPALEDGLIVVCGRYSDSTFAYQGFGAGVPLETLRELDAAATDGLRPDLTILLDLPVEDGLARKGPDDTTRFEAELDLAFHRRVRAGFLELAGEEPDRFVIVDATQSADVVAADVTTAVEAMLTRVSDEPKSPVLRMQSLVRTIQPRRAALCRSSTMTIGASWRGSWTANWTRSKRCMTGTEPWPIRSHCG